MKGVVLLSGGVDSAVALALKVAQFGPGGVAALSVDYGQRHRRELDAAVRIARAADVTQREVVLSALAPILSSSLTVAARDDLTGEPTVVPGRNAILLSVAAGWAQTLGAGEVVIGSHSGDRTLYPDCGPPFIETMDRALRAGYGVSVIAPLLGHTKQEVVSLGKMLEVPFGLCWSCYAGGEAPCGKCGACVERGHAFGLEVLA